MPEQKRIGYSPDMLEELLKQFGGVEGAMGAVQQARAGEQSAPPEMLAMSPEDRAALDRYTTFAKMREQSSGMDVPINYLGGMTNMAATEALKAVPLLQRGASKAYNWVQGTPNAPDFFGGADTSKPNLASLLASHYGYTRGRK
jgi:hypothetical protein